MKYATVNEKNCKIDDIIVKSLSINEGSMHRRTLANDAMLYIRQAFITTFPICIIFNVLLLLDKVVAQETFFYTYFGASSIGFVDFNLFNLLPLFLLLSLTDILATSYSIDRISSILVALSSMIVFVIEGGSSDSVLAITHLFTLNLLEIILFTFINFAVFYWVTQVRIFKILADTLPLSRSLLTAVNMLIPALLVIVFFGVLGHFSQRMNSILVLPMQLISDHLLSVSDLCKMYIYTFIDSFGWFFGLHGSNISQSLIISNESTLFKTHFNAISTAFVLLGGSGATLGLLGAIFLFSKSTYYRTVSKLSLPFVFLNINEILIYGMPIVLNTRFIIPFFIVPLINISIVSIAMHFNLFAVMQPNISWMSPPFYSAYVLSGGNWFAIITQVVCIGVSILVYRPFVKNEYAVSLSNFNFTGLLGNEENAKLMLQSLPYRSEEQYFINQKKSLQSIKDAEKLLTTLEHCQLLLYIQPKVNVSNGSVVGGEVLLRIKYPDGKIGSPYFLNSLYLLGLSGAIDDRVVTLYFEMLQQWHLENKKVPPISINLDKAFLLDDSRIHDFIERADQCAYPLMVEVTEHTYTKELEHISANIRKLLAANIGVSIDDFGSGYSSLAVLSLFEATEIKFDRELVLQVESPKGKVVLAKAKALCEELGCTVIAEGVETKAQLHALQELGITNIQGYFTGKPMPVNEFLIFCEQKCGESS